MGGAPLGYCPFSLIGMIMEYHIEKQDGTVTVQFQGDITFSENNVFRNMLQDISGPHISVWVFELSGVGMIDKSWMRS